MAWTDLKAAVAAVIKTNGNQEITGALLQSTLNSIIDQVGANASYKGEAIPSTNPGTPDALVFYIASTQGPYANFGGFVLDGGFAVLSNVSGSWSGTKFLKTELDAKADKTELVQLAGNILYTDLNSKLSGVKITKGNNLLNRNYVEPSNPYEYEKGGANRLVFQNGSITTSTGWFASPLIEWNDSNRAIITNCRSWAQYASDGVSVKSVFYPVTAQAGTILIEKNVDAVFFRVSLLNGAGNHMLNFGPTLLPFEQFKETVSERVYGETPIYFNPITDEVARFKEMLLSESYIPQSPTYTDGVVNSPINVIWADGDTGVLTLTRNTDGLVTKIVSTKIRSGVTTTLTENITRDSDGNATNITIA